MAEDAGGYFCHYCGKAEPHDKCEKLIYETDIYWDVAIQTLAESLKQEEEAGKQTHTFNKETRKRTMEEILKWRKQSFQRYRLDSYLHSRSYMMGG